MTTRESNIQNLISGITAAARVRFRGQASRVWYAQLDVNRFKAYVINSISKKIMEEACSKTDAEDPCRDALEALRSKLMPSLRSTKETR